MILDRGYIIVEPKEPFITWLYNNQELQTPLIQEFEPSIYLIEDDFMDDDQVLKTNYEEIFVYELEGTGISDDRWPEINYTNFNLYFHVKLGVSVIDLKSK